MTTATRTAPVRADSRMQRALELLRSAHTWQHGTIKATGQRVHLVPGSTGNVYWTTAEACTCRDFQTRGLICKHSIAVGMHEAAEAATVLAEQVRRDIADLWPEVA